MSIAAEAQRRRVCTSEMFETPLLCVFAAIDAITETAGFRAKKRQLLFQRFQILQSGLLKKQLPDKFIGH